MAHTSPQGYIPSGKQGCRSIGPSLKHRGKQDVMHWLHRKTGNKGVHALWEIVKQMGMKFTHVHIMQAHQKCSNCSLKHKRQSSWHLGQIARAEAQAMRSMDYILPLLLSQNCKYALMSIDTATDLLQAYCSKEVTQRAARQGLRQLCATYECL